MDLFERYDEAEKQIDGLRYIPDFINETEAKGLLAEIDTLDWKKDLRRRVQHYGWHYGYKERRITSQERLGCLPEWLSETARLVGEEAGFGSRPDQVIVNEYEPGQGISAHTDRIDCFGDVVASLSLGAPCMMDFSKDESTKEKQKRALDLEPQSLLVLSGSARYDWKHAIAARKNDSIGGVARPRRRRVSLTFRTVILEA